MAHPSPIAARVVALFALGCTTGGCHDSDGASGLTCVGAESPTVTTVVDLACTAEVSGNLKVAFGLAGDLSEQAPPVNVEAGGAVTIPLYGMPEASMVNWQATLSGEAGEEVLEGSTSTGPLPPELNPITLVTSQDTPPGFRYLLGTVFGDQPANFVLNQTGEVVWYRLVDRSLWTIEVMFSHTQSEPTLLSNEFSTDHALDAGQVWRVSREAEALQAYNPVQSHHVFTELGPDAPDGAAGTIAYLALDVRPWYDAETDETVDVVGDRIVEIAPDGTTREVFSTWDWIEVTKPSEWDVPFYPQGKDWTHSNSLQYDADTDTYLLSLDHLEALVEIRRVDGVPVRWIGPDFGGAPDGIGIAKGSLSFFHQHDAKLRDGGLLTVYATDQAEGHSGGVTYRIDDASGTLIEVGRHGYSAGLRSAFLGQMEPLANGNALVNFASGRAVWEVTPAEEVVWSIGVDPGTSFGQVHPFDDFYTGR